MATSPGPSEARPWWRRLTLKSVGVGALLVLLGLFVLLNLERIEVNWIFFTTRSSLAVVIAVSAVVGYLIGRFVGGRRARRR